MAGGDRFPRSLSRVSTTEKGRISAEETIDGTAGGCVFWPDKFGKLTGSVRADRLTPAWARRLGGGDKFGE